MRDGKKTYDFDDFVDRPRGQTVVLKRAVDRVGAVAHLLRQSGHREAAAQTAAAVRALSAGFEGSKPVFLLADSPGLAAVLGFYLPADLPLPPATATRLRCHIPARHAVESDFSFWPGYAGENSWAQADALFVSEDPVPAALDDLRHQFRQIDRFGRIEIVRGGWPVRTLSFFACRSWQGPAR